MNMSWRSEAKCKGYPTNLFFPDRVTGPDRRNIAIAKEVCASCPVRLDCLQWAMDSRQAYGIWGGYTVRERRRLRAGTLSDSMLVASDRPTLPSTNRRASNA